jgi:hypothetical protein
MAPLESNSQPVIRDDPKHRPVTHNSVPGFKPERRKLLSEIRFFPVCTGTFKSSRTPVVSDSSSDRPPELLSLILRHAQDEEFR